MIQDGNECKKGEDRTCFNYSDSVLIFVKIPFYICLSTFEKDLFFRQAKTIIAVNRHNIVFISQIQQYQSTMRVIATLFAFLAVANAFAPTPAGRANTQLSESLMDKVSNLCWWTRGSSFRSAQFIYLASLTLTNFFNCSFLPSPSIQDFQHGPFRASQGPKRLRSLQEEEGE